jgi:hypothetical protein
MAGRDSFVLLFVGLFLVTIHLHAEILVAGETGVIGVPSGSRLPQRLGLTFTSGARSASTGTERTLSNGLSRLHMQSSHPNQDCQSSVRAVHLIFEESG